MGTGAGSVDVPPRVLQRAVAADDGASGPHHDHGHHTGIGHHDYRADHDDEHHTATDHHGSTNHHDGRPDDDHHTDDPASINDHDDRSYDNNLTTATDHHDGRSDHVHRVAVEHHRLHGGPLALACTHVSVECSGVETVCGAAIVASAGNRLNGWSDPSL